ncbi:RHS repeat-associated core domain-containing protein [Bacillus sp. GMa5/2]
MNIKNFHANLSKLNLLEKNSVISKEEYYPYDNNGVWLDHSKQEASYEIIGYSGKERDVTGLYYYGYRYYQPWAGRWLSASPRPINVLDLVHMASNSSIKKVKEISPKELK